MSADFQIKRYAPDQAVTWDKFIDQSANGGFILKRTFMDYHQDRFEDFSYLLWENTKLIAVFAAAMPRLRSDGQVLIAHPGLTYGGLITGKNVKYPVLEELYESLFLFFKQCDFHSLLLKPTPNVFCEQVSEASLFFFYKNKVELVNRELNSVIDFGRPLKISNRQKRNIAKAYKNNIHVESSKDFDAFWQILTNNLQQVHGVLPAHTLEEIEFLASKNPENIALYLASKENSVVGGVVLFKDSRKGYVHSQYIASNAEGKRVGAVDAILFHIIETTKATFQRFSFGISTVKGEINYGLLAHKEGFGARAELVDTYRKIL